MHALKGNILLHLETLANANNYPIIMIDVVVNSLIIFSYNHFYTFYSFFIS